MIAEVFEACMVILFGISWPLNIVKSIRTKSAKGKSFLFLAFILAGYVCGIIGKIVGGNITWVFAFYILNFVMVSVDIVLTIVNKKREEKVFDK